MSTDLLKSLSIHVFLFRSEVLSYRYLRLQPFGSRPILSMPLWMYVRLQMAGTLRPRLTPYALVHNMFVLQWGAWQILLTHNPTDDATCALCQFALQLQDRENACWHLGSLVHRAFQILPEVSF